MCWMFGRERTRWLERRPVMSKRMLDVAMLAAVLLVMGVCFLGGVVIGLAWSRRKRRLDASADG